ncbi:SLATT domain-containing protein [Niveibacterium terrae]|uniref:SLATT domain-containing protein n=1 Tax=Niveibacterium terrae TaxID=3373598 RepID=UPI003A95AD13
MSYRTHKLSEVKAVYSTMKNNLKPTAFPSLQWSAQQRRDSLDKLCAWATEKGDDAIAWYFSKKSAHQIFCRIFRVSAILLVAFSGILPLLNEVTHNAIHSLWSALALAIAVTLVLLDRFYGFTSGWIRFMLAGQQIAQLLEDFQLEIERQKLLWREDIPSQQETLAMIDANQCFLDRLQDIVRKETQQWAREFSEVLKQIDEQIKLKPTGTGDPRKP